MWIQWGATYHALYRADQQTLEDLAGLVAVSYILEGLGGILSANIEQDFLSSSMVLLALEHL